MNWANCYWIEFADFLCSYKTVCNQFGQKSTETESEVEKQKLCLITHVCPYKQIVTHSIQWFFMMFTTGAVPLHHAWCVVLQFISQQH